MGNRNTIPTFKGMPLPDETLFPSPEEAKRVRQQRELVIGGLIFLVLALANVLLYAKQNGWW